MLLISNASETEKKSPPMTNAKSAQTCMLMNDGSVDAADIIISVLNLHEAKIRDVIRKCDKRQLDVNSDETCG